MKNEDKEQDAYIIQMLLDSKLSLKEIADNLNISEVAVNHRIKALDLGWIQHTARKMSRGQTSLTKILQKIIPGASIVNEHHIGERLKLDIYCPSYKLGVEYHGRQHFEHITFFHETFDDFLRAQARDERKVDLCRDLGITLVIFRYTDKLSEDIVYDRLLSAIRNSCDTKIIAKPKLSMKDNPHYQELKHKRNAFQRDLRKKIRQEQKDEKARTKRNTKNNNLGENYN